MTDAVESGFILTRLPDQGRKRVVTITPSMPTERINREDITINRAQAFLRQRYPLTPQGITLQDEIRTTIQSNDVQKLTELADRLPTVEHPQLNLFRELTLTPEQITQIFGHDLANVQVTKGCSHKCDFCAAGASHKIESMPFAAVLKIAEKMRDYEKAVDEAWEDWNSTVKVTTGLDIDQLRAEYSNWRKTQPRDGNNSIYKFVDQRDPTLIQRLTYVYQRHPVRFLSGEHFKGLLDISQATNKTELFQRQITNYYDSDPFDYRDGSFLHEDGSPADYGDVLAALASKLQPIHITTAGWSRHNRIAQRAAEKIVALTQKNPDLLESTRVSVNKYEMRARTNRTEYCEDMKQVMQTLMAAPKQLSWDNVLFFGLDDPSFVEEVVDPLKEFIKDKKIHAGWAEPEVSFYSGTMERSEHKDDHHDVMACMPGYHIWPDGTVAYQKYESDFHLKKVPKGTRPLPTTMKAF